MASARRRRRRRQQQRRRRRRQQQRADAPPPAAAPPPSLVPNPRRAEVDWSRYHLQILFIDADDVLRGRLAAGLFERVAEWNGYGRVLLPWTCGVDADQGGQAGDISTQVREAPGPEVWRSVGGVGVRWRPSPRLPAAARAALRAPGRPATPPLPPPSPPAAHARRR
jgi:hypothetical protein